MREQGRVDGWGGGMDKSEDPVRMAGTTCCSKTVKLQECVQNTGSPGALEPRVNSLCESHN